MYTPLARFTPPDQADRRLKVPGDVAATMRHLVDSAQPAVVFTSLAALSVSAFSDECSVFIEEAGRVGYRIDRCIVTPRTAPPVTASIGAGSDDTAVRTPIRSMPMSGERDYRGFVVHRWHDGHRPTDTEVALAQMVVDRAVDAVHQERLVNRIRRPQRTSPISFAAAAGNRRRAAAPWAESRRQPGRAHHYPVCPPAFPSDGPSRAEPSDGPACDHSVDGDR